MKEWVLKEYFTDSNAITVLGDFGAYSDLKQQQASFFISPQNIKVTPKQRVTIQDTFGETMIVPWYNDKMTDTISRIDISLSGIGRVYSKYSLPEKKKEPDGWLSRLADKAKEVAANIQSGAQETQADRDKKAKAQQNKQLDLYLQNIQAHKSFLELVNILNKPFSFIDNGKRYYRKWQLEMITPVFSKVEEGKTITTIPLIGYITTPMTITEDAEKPFLPSWSFTFSIIDNNVVNFNGKITEILKALQVKEKSSKPTEGSK